MVAKINEKKCMGCGACIATCLFDAVVSECGIIRVKEEDCKGCSACFTYCPVNAIGMI